MTKQAVEALDKILAESSENVGSCLRVRVVGGGCAGFSYSLAIDEPTPEDHVFQSSDHAIVVDPTSMPFLEGSEIDYVTGAMGQNGFQVNNPQSKGACGCGTSHYF